MQLRSRLAATSVAAIPLLALVAAPAALLAADPPVTLRFAIADEEGRPSDPYVRAFVQEVALRSGGSVTLDPTWSAGGDDFEQGVARLLIDGQADLGLAAGRAWSAVGIPALQSLQAPFLIDSDELAEAVATDPLVEPLLAAMGEGGVDGSGRVARGPSPSGRLRALHGARHVAVRPPGPDRASHRLRRHG